MRNTNIAEQRRRMLKDIELFGHHQTGTYRNIKYEMIRVDSSHWCAYIIDYDDTTLTQNDYDKLDELKRLIERYLPIRSRSAIIEATMEDDQLLIAGAVQKTLSFREDLYVDIFDQKGNHVKEIALKDNSSGLFTEVLSQPFESGVYVVQLQYHDVVVTDFFNVR